MTYIYTFVTHGDRESYYSSSHFQHSSSCFLVPHLQFCLNFSIWELKKSCITHLFLNKPNLSTMLRHVALCPNNHWYKARSEWVIRILFWSLGQSTSYIWNLISPDQGYIIVDICSCIGLSNRHWIMLQVSVIPFNLEGRVSFSLSLSFLNSLVWAFGGASGADWNAGRWKLLASYVQFSTSGQLQWLC